jgi:SAM-dependent methyltransferase
VKDMMAVREAADPARTEAFVGKVLGDTTGFGVTLMSSIGDRLGLFKDLAAAGPATSAELAVRTGTNERYAREWLAAMASAGYLTYDPASRRFTLPPEHAPVLAQEAGPFFFGGVQQEFIGFVSVLDRVIDACRNGGGVPGSEYPAEMWEGLSRFTAGWFENLLLPVWLPALPDVAAKLEAGADVADVGCGYGRAAIKLAQAYPRSRITGYDVVPANVERARAAAEEAGVGDRVRFAVLDATGDLPVQYDVITTFDVVHDAVDPLALLASIRRALRPDGIYVCLDINCQPDLEANLGPLGALFLSSSVLFCMTTSLAHGGEGLGTLGLHAHKLEELATAAGFGAVRQVDLENPFNNLYELRPTVGGV